MQGKTQPRAGEGFVPMLGISGPCSWLEVYHKARGTKTRAEAELSTAASQKCPCSLAGSKARLQTAPREGQCQAPRHLGKPGPATHLYPVTSRSCSALKMVFWKDSQFAAWDHEHHLVFNEGTGSWAAGFIYLLFHFKEKPLTLLSDLFFCCS